MIVSSVFALGTPAQVSLILCLKLYARRLLANAVETELVELLAQHSVLETNRKQAITRKDSLPERVVQTGFDEYCRKDV